MAGWSASNKLSNPSWEELTYMFFKRGSDWYICLFPSHGMHKAVIRIRSRPEILVVFPPSAGDFTVLDGDWFKTHYRVR